jgi:predicted secreted protein
MLRRTNFWPLVILFLVSCNAVLAKPFIITDLNKPIVINQNHATFTVQLAANPSTGFNWFLQAGYPIELIQPIHHAYKSPTQKLNGASGVEEWTFKVSDLALKVPTQIHIKFNYQRQWEKQAGKILILDFITSTD